MLDDSGLLPFYARILGLAGTPAGGRSITLPLTYSGTVIHLQWALFDRESEALVKPWTACNKETIAAGAATCAMMIPAGANGRNSFRIGIRASNDTRTAVKTSRFTAVGIGIWGWGQSNMALTGNPITDATLSAAITGAANRSGVFVYLPSSYDSAGHSSAVDSSQQLWKNAASYGETASPTINRWVSALTRIASGANMPVGMIMTGVAGTAAANLQPGSDQYDRYFLTNIANAGGVFEAGIYMQGEAEGLSTASMTVAAKKAQWKTPVTAIINDMRARMSQPSWAPLHVFLGITGSDIQAQNGVSATLIEDGNADAIRQAQIDLTSEIPSVHIGSHYVDAQHNEYSPIVFDTTSGSTSINVTTAPSFTMSRTSGASVAPAQIYGAGIPWGTTLASSGGSATGGTGTYTLTAAATATATGVSGMAGGYLHGLHYSDNGYNRAHIRYAYSILNALGLLAYDGRGPYAGTPSRSGATITIPVALNGVTALTANSNVTGFQVFLASDTTFTTPLTIASASVSGSSIVIVLASAPGAPVTVRSYHGANPDVTSWPSGTYLDGSVGGMMPIVFPITSN